MIVPAVTAEKLQREARVRGLTVAQMFATAVDEYLARTSEQQE